MKIKVRVTQNIRYANELFLEFKEWEDVEVFTNLIRANGVKCSIHIDIPGKDVEEDEQD